MSKLIMDEYPLVVLPGLAKALKSVNAAIILQQIHYWASDRRSQERDGHKWHYETYDKWLIQFPWMSLKTLIRTIEFLEEKNLIISKEYNRLKGDRTKWYRVNYDSLAAIELSLNTVPTTHLVKMTKPSGQNDQTIWSKCPNLYRTETTTETTTENNKQRISNIPPPKASTDSKSVVVFLDEKNKGTALEAELNSPLIEKLSNFGVNKKSSESWIRSYGENTISEKLSMLQGEILKGTPIASKAAWLNVALRQNYKPSLETKMKPHVSHDETQAMLKKMAEHEKLVSKSDRSIGISCLKKLKGKK